MVVRMDPDLGMLDSLGNSAELWKFGESSEVPEEDKH